MSDIDLLRRMIQKNAIVETERADGGQSYLKLEETNSAKGTEYSIKICNVPDECIAIKSDKFPAPNAFFKRDKGQCRRSDYIVISKFKEKNWIVYIELKKGKGQRSRIVEQLQGSQCLFDYCRSLGRSFWKVPTFLESSRYQKCFVSLRATSINKPGSPKKSRPAHDAPDTMLTLIVKNQLHFKQLLKY